MAVESMVTEILRTTIALFVIIDHGGTVPIIVALTKDLDPMLKQKNMRIATYVGTILLLLFSLAGS